jgi:uncharacterized protein YjdB
MNRFGGAVIAALMCGCGNLPTTTEGVAFLEIRPPTALTVAIGATLSFRATALDKSGQPLTDVVVHWRTPDPTIRVSDTGLVTGLSAGTGRVQAFVKDDAMVSDFIVVTVTASAASETAGPR